MRYCCSDGDDDADDGAGAYESKVIERDETERSNVNSIKKR